MSDIPEEVEFEWPAHNREASDIIQSIQPPNIDVSLEDLVSYWTNDIQAKDIMASVAQPDGTTIILGPGGSDSKEVQFLESTKRLINYRPRLEMIQYCLSRQEQGTPFIMLRELLYAIYPGKLPEGPLEVQVAEALRLAENESKGSQSQ